MATTVMVVDDHAEYRASLRRLLESEGYEVVAEVPNGGTAVGKAREHQPRLALVDVYLPDIDGFEVASRLAALDDAPIVVLMSSHERAEIEPLLGTSGASGFLSKSELSRARIEEFI
jgi:CheY-like chemotaxis protein